MLGGGSPLPLTLGIDTGTTSEGLTTRDELMTDDNDGEVNATIETGEPAGDDGGDEEGRDEAAEEEESREEGGREEGEEEGRDEGGRDEGGKEEEGNTEGKDGEETEEKE